jgi:hypothetical protein
VASQGLTNTGDAMNRSNVANFNMLQSAGAAQEMQQQNEINAQMAKFNQAFNYPQQQLGVLESSLGMTPHDTSTSGQSSTSTTTPTDWASIISKGAGAAADIYGMSDRTMKTDITDLGKDPKTGLKMHAFRYKGDPKTYPKVVGPMAQDVQKVAPEAVTPMGKDGKLAIRGYAGGTPFVGQPSLAGFLPPSSPGVAKAIGSMSAFRPPVKLARGAGTPKMQRFAFGTPDVQAPNMDDAELGSQIMGEDPQKARIVAGLKKVGDRFAPANNGGSAAPAAAPQMSGGWNAPSMGYFQTGYARGAASVPGQGPGDTVPAMLTPGEAVLTGPAADHIGRHNIAALNAFMPPVRADAMGKPRAGARGIHGALANTKTRPKIAGMLS